MKHSLHLSFKVGVSIFLISIISITNCAPKQERIKNAREFIINWNFDRALTEIIAYRKDKNAEIQYLLGLCYLNKNEFEEAANYFENSLAINEFFKDSITHLYNTFAQNALKINDPARALFFYQEVAKLVPTYDQANNLFLVGDLDFNQGNYESAVTAYSNALRIDSISARAKKARYKLIKALTECGNFELALQLANQEYQKLKTAANLLQLTEIKFTLGEKLFSDGLLDSALFFFNQITAGQEPKSYLDDAYFYLGEIYLKKNMLDDALASYKKVLLLNPYEKGEIIKMAKERINEIKRKK